MSAIIPSHSIDSEPHLARWLLPYQVAWVCDDSPLRLAEKSVRIGWTYADALKNVRKRLRHPKRDYLFSTKDHPTALEFVQTCHHWLDIFKRTNSIKIHGAELFQVPRFDAEGRDTGFTEDVKVGLIKFDNGSRIIAFSSNPNALRAFGGDVGLDEFAFHPDAEQLWASASGRVTWGYDLGVWSSSNGDDTLFHSFALEAQAGQGGWSYYRVTMIDAIDMGLVEKMNQCGPREQTRAEFLEGCKLRSRLPEVFEQEYMCNPKGGVSAIVPWAAIERCQRDYAIERAHLEESQVAGLFGDFQSGTQRLREQQIAGYIESAFPGAFANSARHHLGFDVAASGQGDLASIYVDRETAGAMQLRALFTCRTQDWHFLRTVLFTFFRRLTDVTACGDETGLGRQICWEAGKQFPGQFTPVNFRSEKQKLGFALMNQLSVGEKQFPKEPKDIAADFYALRKTCQGGRWIFSEGGNPFNTFSHCDIAWAGALSSKAALQYVRPGPILVFPRGGERQRLRRNRAVM